MSRYVPLRRYAYVLQVFVYQLFRHTQAESIFDTGRRRPALILKRTARRVLYVSISHELSIVFRVVFSIVNYMHFLRCIVGFGV